METLKEYCSKLISFVEKNESGHLPLKFRVKLMHYIDDPKIVNKIFFECTKKVYPILKDDYPEDKIFANILNKCDEYLYYNEGNRSDFSSLADEYKNYAESEDYNSNNAAIAIVYLCYSITGNADDILKEVNNYNNNDDNECDSDCWTTDFYASLAYSDGSPFANDGDVEKRKEFWKWFINVSLELYLHPDTPVLELPVNKDFRQMSKDILYERTQSYKTPEILNKIDKIIQTSIQLINQSLIEWKLIVLKSLNLDGGNLYDTLYIDFEENENDFGKIDTDNVQLFSQIKKEMYKQNKKEGAWLQSILIIFPNGEYEYKFNYDNRDTLTYFADDPDELVSEFRAYPRSKEFTPQWWQDILGKRAKYLK